MTKHIPYIFGWKENENDEEGESRSEFYLGLINSSLYFLI